MVKYPILFKEILKHTESNHPDIDLLNNCIVLLEDIIKEVDKATGYQECLNIRSKLDYIEGVAEEADNSIMESSAIICSGPLRNNRGTVRSKNK